MQRGAAGLGHGALRPAGNACFAFFVSGVLIFAIIAATYQPREPLFRPPSQIADLLTSSSAATFGSDDSAARTGADFIAPSDKDALAAEPFMNATDAASDVAAEESADCDRNAPIDCKDPEVFHKMMRAAIERFRNVHFYRFGKPVRGAGDTTCDMAWRFRPKEANAAASHKDYRRFQIARGADCTHSVVSMGEYHTGVNARKKKKGHGVAPQGGDKDFESEQTLPLVGEVVNDSLPVVESEKSFINGRYLIYMGGGDRCKSMNHYLWSLLCALGEAKYLNRTLVMDLSICLSSMYTSTSQDEEGKDFRFYFDLEHLMASASVLDQGQFWTEWEKWQKRDVLSLHLVEDFRVTPMKLAAVTSTLVMRKFGNVEPDNYRYRVCEGETEKVIPRPWGLVRKCPRLLDIVSRISSNMSRAFDSVHVVRGEKARNAELWPNLAADTSPEALLARLREMDVEEGRDLYIATNEQDAAFFDPLRERYNTHFLDDFRELWAEGSEWHTETRKLNGGVGVEFDGYMRVEVDTEVFLRGKKRIETFNDLTRDCKHGIHTCGTVSTRDAARGRDARAHRRPARVGSQLPASPTRSERFRRRG